LFFLSAIFSLSITMTNTKLEFQGVWIHDEFDKITIYYTLRLQQNHGANVFILDSPLRFQSVIVGMMAKGGNSSFEFFLHSYNLYSDMIFGSHKNMSKSQNFMSI
jgi:hypothetical protein